MKPERRFLPAEVRATGDASPRIEGYAAKFGTRSQDLGGFVEIIAPGAFDACLAGNPDILGLYNHDMNQVLGRTSSGTMTVAVDATGSSFGFYCLEETWDLDPETDVLIRTLVKCAVFDCSVVTNPAYLDANSSVRSQFPDAALLATAAQKRSALKDAPDAFAREELYRLDLLLYLAGN
jgi:phage head maturation protease